MKKFLLFLAAFMFVFTTCKKEDIEKAELVLEGYIYDAKTGLAVDNASVVIRIENDTRTQITDATGYFSFGKVYIGEYLIIVKKDGYQTVGDWFAFNNCCEEDGLILKSSSDYTGLQCCGCGVINQKVTITGNLCPLTETLVATIFQETDIANIKYAVSNEDFQIFLSPWDSPITGSTDSDGLLTLDSLPDCGYFTLFMEYEDGGYAYILNTHIYGVPNGITAYTANRVNPEGDFGLVSTNVLDSDGNGVDDFDVGDVITVRVTHPVDTSLSTGTIFLTNPFTVLIEIEWNASLQEFTITPENDLPFDTQHSLYFNLTSQTGDTYARTLVFRTAAN